MAIIIMALGHFSSVSAASEKVCQTRTCWEYAKKLQRDMNWKVDPCTNFYEYVCGNWNKNHRVPTYRPLQSQNTLIWDTIKNRLREIFTKGSIDGKNPFVKKAKKLYKACMDIKKNGIGEIMNYVKETGGWPIIMNPGEWEKSKKPWQTVDSEYNVIMGTSLFYDFALHRGKGKPPINYLAIHPSFSPGHRSLNSTTLKSDGDLFIDPAIVKKIELIKKIAKVMAREGGFEINERQIEEDAQGIVRFFYYFKYIVGLLGSESAKVTTIEKFQAFFESASPSVPTTRRIDWLQRIRQLFAWKSSVSVNSTEKLVVYHASYFKSLSSFLDKFSERDIVNTIQWWFVQQTVTYTNPEMLGIDDLRPRFTKCIEENELQYALAYVQVEKDNLEKTKARVVDMVEKVKVAMKEEISESKWLDDDSKRAAEEKIDGMTTLVGYPDWYKDPNMLGNEPYNNLLKGSSYLENVLLGKQFRRQQKLELLGKPFDKWSKFPTIINPNAHQRHDAHIIAFPVGILQKPMFNVNYPDAVNYGGMGNLIGHEISHAFDSRGIHFDKHGNKEVWWSNNATLKHEKRCQRFIDQFNNYGGSGTRTINENIADSTGVIAAFRAYKKHIGRSHYRKKKLPGLENLSSDKLFFVSLAWTHCMNVKPEFVGTLLNNDVHSPSPQRVNGALSNSKDFSKAFQCKKNSPMNPSVKCTIW